MASIVWMPARAWWFAWRARVDGVLHHRRRAEVAGEQPRLLPDAAKGAVHRWFPASVTSLEAAL